MMAKRKKGRGARRKGADAHGFAKGDRVRYIEEGPTGSHTFEGVIIDSNKDSYHVRFDDAAPGGHPHRWCQRRTVQLVETKEALRRRASAPTVGTSLGSKLEEAQKPKASAPVVDMAQKRFDRDLQEWQSMRDAAQKTLEEAMAEHERWKLREGESRDALTAALQEVRRREDELDVVVVRLLGALGEVEKAQEALELADSMRPTLPEPPEAGQEVPAPPSPTAKGSRPDWVGKHLYVPEWAPQTVQNIRSQDALMVLRVVCDLPAEATFDVDTIAEVTGRRLSAQLGNLFRSSILQRPHHIQVEGKLTQYRRAPFFPKDAAEMRPLTREELLASLPEKK